MVTPVDCKSAALVHCVFKSHRLHQIWSCHIVAIIPACLVGYRGSIPRRIAKFIFHSSTAVVQLTVNQLVVGSIPACGASFRILSAKIPTFTFGCEKQSVSCCISRCSEMASPVVWDHVAQVRFLPPRPVVLAFIDGVEKDKLSITNFGLMV